MYRINFVYMQFLKFSFLQINLILHYYFDSQISSGLSTSFQVALQLVLHSCTYCIFFHILEYIYINVYINIHNYHQCRVHHRNNQSLFTTSETNTRTSQR